MVREWRMRSLRRTPMLAVRLRTQHQNVGSWCLAAEERRAEERRAEERRAEERRKDFLMKATVIAALSALSLPSRAGASSSSPPVGSVDLACARGRETPRVMRLIV